MMTPFREHDQAIRVQCDNAPWRRGVEFLIRQGRSHRGVVTFEEIPDGSIPEPSFMLAREDAQSLMDELWACGFRPTEGSGSAGSLAATQRHLDDMRKLVFDNILLKIRENPVR